MTVAELGATLLYSSAAFAVYTAFAYPATLAAIAKLRKSRQSQAAVGHLPSVSISLPVYNEEKQIAEALDALLALDYPADLLQILVISDASTDATDAIVQSYAARGVELLRLSQRSGKTAAENAGATRLRGDIVINTDASIRIRKDAVKRLVTQFADPTIGVASGRDLSVSRQAADANLSEAGYVGYEMRIRSLETRVGGIIGASGCFYAVRRHLHNEPLPDHLSRDFAAALIAREHGYRAVSVDDAVCLVPRTGSLRHEFRRKARTIGRGMETLAFKRHLLNPLRYGVFAWMLFSHKVCRWLTPVFLLTGVLGLALLGSSAPWARWLLAVTGFGALLSLAGWYWPEHRSTPRLLAVLSSFMAVQVATFTAMLRALRGRHNPTWEPTRRDGSAATRPLVPDAPAAK